MENVAFYVCDPLIWYTSYYVVGWRPANGDRHPYLQVDLRSLYRVTGLRVQGTSYYARGVIVLYSEDGWTWTAYSDDQSDNARQFEANHSPNDINHINFATPFTVELIFN